MPHEAADTCHLHDGTRNLLHLQTRTSNNLQTVTSTTESTATVESQWSAEQLGHGVMPLRHEWEDDDHVDELQLWRAPVVAHNGRVNDLVQRVRRDGTVGARLSPPRLHPRTAGPAQQTSATSSMHCSWRICGETDHGNLQLRHDRKVRRPQWTATAKTPQFLAV